MWNPILCLLLAVVCLDVTFGVQHEEGRIDDFVNRFLECSGIPGLMLAAVKDGETFMTKGYGTANLETGERVTSSTLFNIASVTKTFTALLVAQTLAKQETYTWDSTIRDILGDDFHFPTGYRSNLTNIRDIFSHRTGLSRHDNVWRWHTVPREEVPKRVRFMEALAPLRTQFSYNNIMYALAGEVAVTLDGQGRSYEDLTEELIFNKLNMTDATFIYRADENYTGFALPYTDPVNGIVTPRKYFDGEEPVAPGGAICLHAEDAAKWLNFLLGNVDDDVINGTLVSQLMQDEFVTGNVPLYEKPRDPETVIFDAVLNRGLFRGSYRGMRFWSHVGNYDGFHSFHIIFPGINTAVHVSMNANDLNRDVRRMLTLFVVDIVAGFQPWFNVSDICDMIPVRPTRQDQVGLFDEVELDGEDEREVHEVPKEKIIVNKGNQRRYIGNYGHYLYGNIDVNLTAFDTLELMLGPYEFDLFEGQDDSFSMIGRDAAAGHVNPGLVVFGDFNGDVFNEAYFSLEDVRFVRGRSLDNAPPPDPTSCVDT